MKITPDHLARGAFIYIRQSTVDQLANNHESRRRQYGLADRARALGWTDVTVIDDDLGRSGSGVSRPGFERLLAAICEGRVGAVFAIEASRLARNGRDWHTLIEFCGLVGTVIVDEDGTYEPRHPNDRLLLGMKGTMSELELSLLRARSMEALKQKARRGELFFTVAVGYVKVGHDKIEMDPDLRVREAIGLVFTRFAEMQSIRQVFLSLRGDQIALPYIDPKVSGQHQVLWKLPVYTTVSNLLTNPVYAGAYAFGRTGSRMIIENGRKRIVRGRRKDRSDWAVLLVDHHEGYLSWADFERNQQLIADNANGKGMMVRGPVRKGEALLAGLLRCGHCGRRLLVSYNGTKGDVGRYNCDATRSNPGAAPCISFGALRVDEAVGAEIVRLLQPLGVEAAIQAITQCEHQSGEKQRQIELALEQARYEATRARRQYDAVDPDNRLVAGELERRWNAALAAVRALEEELEALLRQRPATLSAEERKRLLQMGADLEAAWHHPAATAVTRKRIIRVVLREVVACVEDDQIHLLLHWQGGDHTRLMVRKNRRGQTRWSVEPETVELIRACARLMPDKAIAGMLNRTGKRTGRSNGWTQSRVRGFRNTHGITVYRDGEWAERGEVTLPEAARMLNLSPLTVLRQIRAGVIPATQYCAGAPWVIKRRDIEDPHVIERVRLAPLTGVLLLLTRLLAATMLLTRLLLAWVLLARILVLIAHSNSSYTMVYGIVGMINFAHGDIFMIGGFIALLSFLVLVSIGLTAVPVILLIVLLVSMAITALYGWTVERIAYRPLRHSFRLAPMLSAIGMSFVLTNYSQVAQGARVKPVPPIITGGYMLHEGSRGFVVQLSNIQIIVVLTTVALLLIFTWLVARTRLGRDMRACEQDQTMAALLGVDVDRTISMTFVIGAALAAVAGMMYLLYYGLVDFLMGFVAGIKAFTAAVLGGIGSLPGAMLGGLAIGMIETLWSAYFSVEYKDVAAFSILIVVLIFMPTGLLGRPEVEKV